MNARTLAEKFQLSERARFEHIDAREPLPFRENSFDAIISIDAMNHLPNREKVFPEWHRVLRPGGRFLFTDATIVTGTLTNEEIIDRSSGMGLFLFTPAGAHERSIDAAGFVEVEVEDVTGTIADVARRWHEAREQRRQQLLEIETAAECDRLQKMLKAASTLASERRLSRFAYSARK
jgi:SAM-dependent methyltransferase